MQLFRLNKILLVGLLLLLKLTNTKAQEVINAVRIEKINASLFRVQYTINPSGDYKYNTVTLKIFRKRNDAVEEIFSEPITPENFSPQIIQTYSYNWQPDAKTIQAGDALQAKIVVSYSKPSVARPIEQPKPNVAPKADAGVDIEVHLPVANRIVLDGIRSYDVDGRIVDINWQQTAGPTSLIIASPKSYKTSVTGEVKAGVYSFELTVKDDAGQSSADRVDVRVKPAAQSKEQVNTAISKKNETVTKPAMVKPPAPKLKGGPNNALLTVLLPGVGHYFVSGNYNGEGRKPKSFIITALYAGSIGGAVYYKLRSNQQYNKYIDLSKFREYQRDDNGNVIGIRGANQAMANQYLSDSKNSRNNFLILTAVSAGIVTADMLYTLFRGLKNMRQWKNEYSAKTDLFISSGASGFTAGIRVKL